MLAAVTQERKLSKNMKNVLNIKIHRIEEKQLKWFFSPKFLTGMSKGWLSIPDVKSNTDTLGKQNMNYKTFYSFPKVS